MKNIVKHYQNPILPGFYPDPSICRVNDDYYLVTSTFAYFPGVPIFHSKDLVHWEQIGNILDRKSQLPLQGSGVSEGIFAPTLRYHNGTFYMITTHVSNSLGNFIVTATDPRGPWSDPYPLGSEGIDPSLFFDDDGTCYYCGTKSRREGSRYSGDNEIYVQKLDLDEMKLVGESYPIWHGALRNVVWPEGPHIYKINGMYYLLISEAGTDYHHAISIARSKELFAPFEGNRANPIFTHRNLGRDVPIVNVGHPDIVQTQTGEWWMVLLASRPYGGYYRNLGRETFLTPMTWEDGWPIVNPGKGILEEQGKAPDLETYFVPEIPGKEDFDTDKLPMHFLTLRGPDSDIFTFNKKKSCLSLPCSSHLLSGTETPAYVARRQQHMDFSVETSLSFQPGSGEMAGLCLFQNETNHLKFGIQKDQLVLTEIKDGTERTCFKVSFDNSEEFVQLKIEARSQSLTCYYKKSTDTDYILAGFPTDTSFLCTDFAGGFVGNTIGLFAETVAEAASDSQENYAHFDYLQYLHA